jgi:hypothetical protein
MQDEFGRWTPMRVRRGLLFWGLLLIPLGAIPLVVQAGNLDPGRLVDAWRFWPLIVIGIGLLIIGSRTWLGLVGLAVVALTIGTIGGAALANGSAFFGAIGACGIGSDTTASVDKSGAFTAPADVRLDLSCGTIDLRPADGPGWTVHATYRGTAPTVDDGPDHLDVTSPDSGDRNEHWTVGLPTDGVRSLEITANAATTTADLGSSSLDELRGDLNAGDFRAQAGSAKVAKLEMTLNAGRIRLTLGAGSTTGSLSVNAGAIDLCVPPASGLRLTVDEQLTFVTNLSSRDLGHDGNVWSRPASGGDTIELAVSGSAATFNLDPNGGC